MRKMLLVLFVALASAKTRAGTEPTAATIISENSVNCGTKAQGHHHKEEQDLMCQEYIVRRTTTEYHIQQPKQKDESLLPLNSKIDFKTDKDKMKFKSNGKTYEFLVVSEAAVSPAKQ